MANSNENDYSYEDANDAVYVKTGIPAYDGNPLIEALPSIFTREAAAEELAYYEPFDKSMRKADDHIRKQYLQTCLGFFTPLDIHLDFEHRFSCALRMGYKERNFLKKGHWGNAAKALSSPAKKVFNQYGNRLRRYKSTAAYGFNVFGVSGGGKSQGANQISNIYPQVINHTLFEGEIITERQLVWLKLDCPHNGSIPTLCLNILSAVDDIMQTNYLEDYQGKKPNAILAGISKVASNHHLGVLIIDEIQRLRGFQKGGRARQMLDFFVELVNTIRIPVILIGTYKAMDIFALNFSQGRRGTGEGDIVWERMKFNEDWELFVESMWRYEITRKPTPAKEIHKLSRVLYEETQGIVDLAIKAFLFAQELAIDIGTQERAETGVEKDGERITAGIIRSVARDKFNMLRPALDALKENQPGALIKFDDLYNEYLDIHKDKTSDTEPAGGEASSASDDFPNERQPDPKVKSLLSESQKELMKFFEKSMSAEPDGGEIQSENSESQPSTPPKKRSSKKRQKASNGVLPDILKNSGDGDENGVYEAFKKANYTVSSEEFFSSGTNGIDKGGI